MTKSGPWELGVGGAATLSYGAIILASLSVDHELRFGEQHVLLAMGWIKVPE